ncbi:hypothetical protein BgiBS90_008116, partial [Biomphalaria glabrata]
SNSYRNMIARIVYLSLFLTILCLLNQVSGDYYSVLSAVSYSCQNQVSTCITNNLDVQYLVNKQNYCDAVNYNSSVFNSKACLVNFTGGCTSSEYTQIQSQACSTKGTIGVVSVTLQCQKQAEMCLDSSKDALALFLQRKYCKALLYTSDIFNAKNCLVVNGECTEDEYSKVKVSVCSATSLLAGMTTLILSVFFSLLN